jgi:hypothetical protein
MHQIKTAITKITGYRTLATIGTLLFVTGAALDGLDAADMRALGAVIVVASLARWSIRPALIPQIDLYRAGHESGYDEGFHDGRRSIPLRVIPGGISGDQASAN